LGGEWLLLDNAVSSLPLEEGFHPQRFRERRATELFIRDLVVQLADFLLVVVNDTTVEEQYFLHTLLREDKSHYKQFYILHNFKDVTSLKQLEAKKELVMQNFPGGKETEGFVKQKVCFFWEQYMPVPIYKDDKALHLFIAQDGSAAGQHNDLTFQLLRQMLRDKLVSDSWDFVMRLTEAMSQCAVPFCADPRGVEIVTEKSTRGPSRLLLQLQGDTTVRRNSPGLRLSDPPEFTPPHCVIETEEGMYVLIDLPGVPYDPTEENWAIPTIECHDYEGEEGVRVITLHVQGMRTIQYYSVDNREDIIYHPGCSSPRSIDRHELLVSPEQQCLLGSFSCNIPVPARYAQQIGSVRVQKGVWEIFIPVAAHRIPLAWNPMKEEEAGKLKEKEKENEENKENF